MQILFDLGRHFAKDSGRHSPLNAGPESRVAAVVLERPARAEGKCGYLRIQPKSQRPAGLDMKRRMLMALVSLCNAIFF